MIAKLDAGARDAALASLPGWDYDADRDGLRRRFVFADFVAAFGFMTQVALLAEKRRVPPDLRPAAHRAHVVRSLR